MPIPFLTAEQMAEVDRLMIEEYQVSLLQMMENAGRQLADLARSRFLGGDPRGKQVVVLAGSGGNGGGGLTAARHLHNWGAAIEVILTRPQRDLNEVPARQAEILSAMDVSLSPSDLWKDLPDADLILDALIGYSLQGEARGEAARLILLANSHQRPILSLDVPSGLDATRGAVFSTVIKAAATLTLALPKTGLAEDRVGPYVGELYLADISVPPNLYQRLGLEVGAIFADRPVIPLG